MPPHFQAILMVPIARYVDLNMRQKIGDFQAVNQIRIILQCNITCYLILLNNQKFTALLHILNNEC